MYIYIYIHTYIHVYIYMYLCMFHIYVNICIYIHIQTLINIHKYLPIDIHICIYIHIYVYMYMFPIYVFTYMYIYVYTCTYKFIHITSRGPCSPTSSNTQSATQRRDGVAAAARTRFSVVRFHKCVTKRPIYVKRDPHKRPVEMKKVSPKAHHSTEMVLRQLHELVSQSSDPTDLSKENYIYEERPAEETYTCEKEPPKTQHNAEMALRQLHELISHKLCRQVPHMWYKETYVLEQRFLL